MICEICGGRASKLRKVIVEGSIMNVCPDCFNTLSKKIPVEKQFPEITSKTVVKKKSVVNFTLPKPVEKKVVKTENTLESMELVDNYRELMRNRMKELGWDEEELGAKTGLKASLIRKIESGKIVPSIPDAKKIEDVLKIRLIKPVSESQERLSVKHVAKPFSTITLGDVIRGESLNEE